MQAASIADIEAFLTRFRRFDQAAYSEHFDRFCADFRRFQADFECACLQAAEDRRRTASAFNVFQVLQRTYDEVGTHSALLANLLNPQESHGQGTLFLKGFLRRHSRVLAGLPVLTAPLPMQGWAVTAELPTDYGYLDLVVSSSSLRYLCVIENKLLAGEQPEQLARYCRWLDEQSHYPYRELFYLTPGGWPSTTSSGAVYYQLAYQTDIIEWLEEALALVEAPRLIDILQQYLDVLSQL
jgi:hypothetical protein